MTLPNPGEVWRRRKTDAMKNRTVKIVSVGDDGIVATDERDKKRAGRRVLISKEAWLKDGWEQA